MVKEKLGPRDWAIRGVALLIALYHLLFILGLLDKMGIHLFSLSYRGGSLALVIAMCYLTHPARKGAGLQWYDYLLMASGVGSALYMMINAGSIMQHHAEADYLPNAIAFFFLAIPLLEILRRITGKVMTGMIVLFFLYPLLSTYVPGVLGGRSFPVLPFVSYLYSSQEGGPFGLAYGVASSIIIVFVMFSQFLLMSGAGDFFLKLAMSLFGQMRGGPAKVAVVGSALFGTISGSPSANVAGTGSFTIPLMKRTGYKPSFAGAVEAVASTGGQLTPPVMGSVLFVMSDITGISYGRLCIASAIPAFLYYLALYIAVHMEAVRTGLQGVPRSEVAPFFKTLKEGWFYIVPVISLVFFLIVLRWSPENSGLYSILILVIVSFIDRKARMTPARILKALEDGAKSFIIPAIVCASVGIIIGSVLRTALGVKLSGFLIGISGGQLVVLLALTAVVCYILGMGLDTIALYIMMVTLTAPALLKMGIETMPAHLFVLWYGISSFITPPVAISVYVACSIANSNVWRTGWTAMRLGLSAYMVPFMFVLRPELLIIGDVLGIMEAIIAAGVGIGSISIALSGQFMTKMNWFERATMLPGGLLLASPGLITDCIGLLLVAVATLSQLKNRKQEEVPSRAI